jgi:hypothetical protein
MEVADDWTDLDSEHTHAGAAFDTLRTCCNCSDAKSGGRAQPSGSSHECQRHPWRVPIGIHLLARYPWLSLS